MNCWNAQQARKKQTNHGHAEFKVFEQYRAGVAVK